MKRILLTTLLALVTLSIWAQDDNTERLWYDKPASIWLEALPIGNSRLGGMVYGGTTTAQLQLNEETFWSGGPHNNNSKTSLQYLTEVRSLIFDGKEREAENIINQQFIPGPHGMKFLTLGSVKMDFGHEQVQDFCRELDLQTAIATTSYINNGVKYTRRVIASMADGVVVVHIKASKKTLGFKLYHDCKLPNVQVTAAGQSLTAIIPGVDHEGIKAALTAQCRTDVKTNGTVRVDGQSLVVEGASEATLYISGATNFVNYNDVSGNAAEKNNQYLTQAETMNFDQLLKRHLAKYQEQYKRVNLKLTSDPEIAKLPTPQRLDKFYGSKDMGMVALLFNYGRYLLISSSQEGGQAANLQGVWNDKVNAPWDSKYTININAEMNYWPAEVCNIAETNGPLFSMIKDLSETGKVTARQMYGCRGWMAHHNTDIWRVAGPVDGAAWGMFPNGGAWLATHLWEHYLYTLDKDFLREYYPVLRGAAEFCLDWLIEKDGHLMTSPSTSPENEYLTPDRYRGYTVYGGSADIAMIRECLTDALAAAKELKVDKKFCDEITQALPRLLPYKIGAKGNLQEWYHDWNDADPQHRHQSHLFGLYPGHQIEVSDKSSLSDLARACAKTLEIKGDNTTGWSTGWRVNLYARLHDAVGAYRIYRRLLKYVSPDNYRGEDYQGGGGTYPNLLDAHSPFQIDGNFGGCAGVVEMLMQSSENTITLLPALPEQWAEGEVRGICARGGFEVDMRWKEGKVVNCTIRSKKGGTTTVSYNGIVKTLKLKAGGKTTLL